MPELPEVETVVRGLSKYLPGQKVKSITAPLWGTRPAKSLLLAPGLESDSARGLTIKGLTRRGKGIIITLSKDTSLLIHLKMTGQLIYVDKAHKRLNFGHPDANFIATMPSPHTRVIIELTKGTLYFNDQRLFGWVKVLPTAEIENDPFIRRLGPEPLTRDFTPEVLWAAIQRRARSSIKSIILDQAVVVGVGNIYADEALFAAKILPTRVGKDITHQEAGVLAAKIKQVLTTGIKYSGTSMSHFKTAEGATGRMQNYLKVYGRGGQPCQVCATSIKKMRTAGRGTHYCSHCQK